MKRVVFNFLLAAAICGATYQAQAEDFFVIYGQSHGVGQCTNNNPYNGLNGDELYAKNDTLVPLADPTGFNGNTIYPVYSGPSGGSSWPAFCAALDTRTAHRIIIVNAAIDGFSISQLQPGADHLDTTTPYGVMNHRVHQLLSLGYTFKGVLYWQWETDAHNAVTTAYYQSNLVYLASNIWVDCGGPTMPCIGTTLTNGDMIHAPPIFTAISNVWDNFPLVPGPVLTDLVADDGSGVHIVDTNQVDIAGLRWEAKVAALFYPIPEYAPFVMR